MRCKRRRAFVSFGHGAQNETWHFRCVVSQFFDDVCDERMMLSESCLDQSQNIDLLSRELMDHVHIVISRGREADQFTVLTASRYHDEGESVHVPCPFSHSDICQLRVVPQCSV